jgi:hypothetical protein
MRLPYLVVSVGATHPHRFSETLRMGFKHFPTGLASAGRPDMEMTLPIGRPASNDFDAGWS